MRVLDFQHHFVPRELAERRGARGARHDVPEGGMKKVTLHGKLYDPEEQLRDMDERGLDTAILSCIIGWDVAHFGGGIASIKERLVAKAYRFGSHLTRSFDDSFDQLYFDMSGFEGGPAALRCALTGIKPERMVFATDYPQDFTGATTDTGKGAKDMRKYIEEIRSLPLPEATKAAMLGGTAEKLLGLSR